MRPEDFASDPDLEVWPENWDSVTLFCDLGTQWVHGSAGPTGMNYLVVYAKLDRLGLSEDDREDMMYCIRVLERAALVEIHRDRPDA
ncbi:DUF1799 domain-containing protein [Kerstersia gyiorum]|uniref:DUF1799 domain-containing protein n=1 Tax=Kerstersia gyiorum TaxID=206506 RepID=UPI003564C806